MTTREGEERVSGGPHPQARRAPAPRLLLIEDDKRLRAQLRRGLEAQRPEVVLFDYESGAQALDEAPGEIDWILCDLKLELESGLDLIEPLKARYPEAILIILSGYGSVASAVEALRRGAAHMLSKPVSIEALLQAFEQLESGRAVIAPYAGEETSPPPQAPSLARVEWEHIQRVLQDCEGNISQAARVLGIHRRTLQRKLQLIPPKR